MSQELLRGYNNFLLTTIKTYFLGSNMVQDEIDFFTNKKLVDGLIFFLFAFDKVDSKLVKSLTIKDPKTLSEYIDIEGTDASLTLQGEKLKKYLEEKFAVHVSMLDFNGIKPQYIAKVNTVFKRFEKFWQTIVSYSNKKSGQ